MTYDAEGDEAYKWIKVEPVYEKKKLFGVYTGRTADNIYCETDKSDSITLDSNSHKLFEVTEFSDEE